MYEKLTGIIVKTASIDMLMIEVIHMNDTWWKKLRYPMYLMQYKCESFFENAAVRHLRNYCLLPLASFHVVVKNHFLFVSRFFELRFRGSLGNSPQILPPHYLILFILNARLILPFVCISIICQIGFYFYFFLYFTNFLIKSKIGIAFSFVFWWYLNVFHIKMHNKNRIFCCCVHYTYYIENL